MWKYGTYPEQIMTHEIGKLKEELKGSKGQLSLGIDSGTNSQGTVIVDDNNTIKYASVSKFEEASTAKDRTKQRNSRHVDNREKERHEQFEEKFGCHIKYDDKFFIRRKNSAYHPEDKDACLNGDLNTTIYMPEYNYDDAAFNKDFPTIEHLKKEFIDGGNNQPLIKKCPEFLFIILYNALSNRGLMNGQTGSDDVVASNLVYESLCNLLYNSTEVSLPRDINVAELAKLGSDKTLKVNERIKNVKKFLGVGAKDKIGTTVCTLICGGKIKIDCLFPSKIIDGDKVSIKFSDEKIDDMLDKIYTTYNFTDNETDLLEAIKMMYNIIEVNNIMNGAKYLCEAKVNIYNEHGKQLKQLKYVYDKYCNDKYKKMFLDGSGNSYSAYTGHVNSSVKPEEIKFARKLNTDDFYKVIKDDLKDFVGDPDVDEILLKIEQDDFLIKQKSKKNSCIPNYIHMQELNKILDNASEWFPFLNEPDENGFTPRDYFTILMTSKRDYFVGSISKGSKNSVAVRTSGDKITPFNLMQCIDMTKTMEAFMDTRIKCCMFMSEHKALPKNSIDYQVYCILNEINTLKINGIPISVELKQEIFELFKDGKSKTKKQIASFLKKKGLVENENQVSGIGNTIGGTLESYNIVKNIIGDLIDTPRGKAIAEFIILAASKYDQDYMIVEKLSEEYGDVLTEEQIEKASHCRFKGWGKYSKELLQLRSPIHNDKNRLISIMEVLWETNQNLMQILYNKDYTFGRQIDGKYKRFAKPLSQITEEDLDSLYLPSPVKRSIRHAIKVVNELMGIVSFKDIYIEMPRGAGNDPQCGKKRKDKVLELYNKKNDPDEIMRKRINSLSNKDFADRKVYLYFLQKGVCLYTKKEIPWKDIKEHRSDFTDDHIHAQTWVVDNNIENNIALVDRYANEVKDKYPVPKSFRDKCKDFWKELLDEGFMTPEKYNRLMEEEYSDQQMSGFIERQLVETRWTCKAIVNIFKAALPDVKIVCTNASNISNFRDVFKIPKIRMVNDDHHAVDAYINVIAGRAFLSKFTENPINFIEEEKLRFKKEHPSKKKIEINYNISNIYKHDIVRNGKVIWKAGKNGTIKKVYEELSKLKPTYIRKTCEKHGKIADVEPKRACNAKDNLSYMPIKKGLDIKKYGGYTDINTAYFLLVEHTVKGKKRTVIEPVPIFMKDKLKTKKEQTEFCKDYYGLTDPVIIRKILAYSLMKIEGFYYYITGASNSQILYHSAVPMRFSLEWDRYIKHVESFNLREKQYPFSKRMNDNKDKTEQQLEDAIEKELQEKLNKGYDVVNREKNVELYKLILDKYDNTIFSKKRSQKVTQDIRNGYEKFKKLSIRKQCYVLGQIFNITACNGLNGDLSDIGGSKNAGKITISKDITKLNGVEIYDYSVSGIYRSYQKII